MNAPRGSPRIDPESTSNLDRLENDLAIRISAFSAAAHSAAVAAQPTLVHELVSAVEGLLAFVTVWSDLLPAAARSEVVPELRSLLRRARRPRDLQSRIAVLDRHLRETPPAARAAARPLREEMSRRLGRAIGRLRAHVTPVRVEHACDRLRALVPQIHAALPHRLRAFEGAHRAERRRREQALATLRNATGPAEAGRLAGSRKALRRWRRVVSCLHAAGAGVPPERQLLGELESTLESLRSHTRVRRLIAKRLRSAAARDAMALPALEIAAEHAALLERARRLAIGLLSPEPETGAARFRTGDDGDDSARQ